MPKRFRGPVVGFLHARLLAELGAAGDEWGESRSRYVLCGACGGRGCRVCRDSGFRDNGPRARRARNRRRTAA